MELGHHDGCPCAVCLPKVWIDGKLVRPSRNLRLRKYLLAIRKLADETNANLVGMGCTFSELAFCDSRRIGELAARALGRPYPGPKLAKKLRGKK